MVTKSASSSLFASLLALGASLGIADRARADDIRNAFGVPPAQTGGQFPGPQPTTPAFPPQDPSGQAPSAPPPAARQPMSIQQYLVSTWHGQSQTQDQQWDIVVTFLPDGTFAQQQTLTSNNFRLQIVGQYQAQIGPQGGVLQFVPQRWEPQQFCQGQNFCQPITMQPLSLRFRLVDHDTLQTEQGTFQRVAAVD